MTLNKVNHPWHNWKQKAKNWPSHENTLYP